MPDKNNTGMEAYRSGHNEAVLKTVCPKGTGVRIPQLPPTARNTNPCGSYFFLFTFFWGFERVGRRLATHDLYFTE